MPDEGALLSHFLHGFPGLYLNSAWPTQDKIIPYKLFYVLMGALPYVWAMDRMLAAAAYTQAKAITQAKTQQKAERTMRQMNRAAIPMRKL